LECNKVGVIECNESVNECEWRGERCVVAGSIADSCGENDDEEMCLKSETINGECDWYGYKDRCDDIKNYTPDTECTTLGEKRCKESDGACDWFGSSEGCKDSLEYDSDDTGCNKIGEISCNNTDGRCTWRDDRCGVGSEDEKSCKKYDDEEMCIKDDTITSGCDWFGWSEGCKDSLGYDSEDTGCNKIGEISCNNTEGRCTWRDDRCVVEGTEGNSCEENDDIERCINDERKLDGCDWFGLSEGCKDSMGYDSEDTGCNKIGEVACNNTDGRCTWRDDRCEVVSEDENSCKKYDDEEMCIKDDTITSGCDWFGSEEGCKDRMEYDSDDTGCN
jgi:hypothetical protein